MKKFYSLIAAMILMSSVAFGQTLDELRAQKAETQSIISSKEAEIATLKGNIASLSDQINYLVGWRKGVSGLIGFNFANNNNWVKSPNPNSQSQALNLTLNGYANYDKPKYFWNNNLIITKAWQDLDLSDGDADANKDGLFDNGTVDILNISSLAGYKLTPKFALSGLGELSTSLGNFLEPGVLDLGLGVTWLPVKNMTVVFHPVNMHAAWLSEAVKKAAPMADNPNITFGAKLRADYTSALLVAGRKIAWSSTLTSFLPYSDNKFTFDELGVDGKPTGKKVEVGAFEYTWLNTLSFDVWKGIGVGVGFGLRNAEFESKDVQSFYTVGLSYGF